MKEKIKLLPDEIERRSNRLLEEIIDQLLIIKDFKPLSNEPKREVGTDFIIEIRERVKPYETRLSFRIQNKGSQAKLIPNTKGNNKGKITLTLDNYRQLEYFCVELDEPLLITYCDLETKSIYWEPIQLNENQYTKRLEKIRNEFINKIRDTPSIQVYFNYKNKIASNGRVLKSKVDLFMSDIVKSRQRLLTRIFSRSKYDFINDGDRGNLNEKLLNQNTIEALLLIRREFKDFKFIPSHILVKFYPFSLSNKSISRYFNGVVTSDNEDLIGTFDKIWNHNGFLINKHTGLRLDRKIELKYKIAIDFFKNQAIHKIELNGKFGVYVNIYNLTDKGECQSIKCLYDNLDYKNCLTKIRSLLKQNRKSELLAYGLSKFGYFVDAFNMYENLIIDNERNKILNVLNLFRQIKLRWAIKINYFDDKSQEIAQKIQLNSSLSKLYEVQPIIKSEVFNVLLYILEEDFVHRSVYDAQKTLNDIRNQYYSDQWGNWSYNNKHDNLLSLAALFDETCEGNLINYISSGEYELIIHNLLEGCLISSQISNANSSKITTFNDNLIGFFINNIDPSVFKRIIQNYRIHSIDYVQNNEVHVVNYLGRIRKFTNSINVINEAILKNDIGEQNYYLRNKFNQIFQNLLLFGEYLVLKEDQINIITSYFIKIILNAEHILPTTITFIESYFINRRDSMNSKFIRLLITHIEKTKRPDLYHEFDVDELLKHKDLKGEFHKILLSSIKYYESDTTGRSPVKLLDDYRYCSLELQNRIKILIERYLSKGFNSDLFFNAVMHDVIDFSKYENEYIQKIQVENKGLTFRQAFGRNDPFDYRINDLINICYKMNIDVRKYSHLLPSTDYYIWLADLENFNYDRFDPYWILEYKTSIYFKRFASVSKIKLKVKESLITKPNQGLTQIYLNYFEN